MNATASQLAPLIETKHDELDCARYAFESARTIADNLIVTLAYLITMPVGTG